MRLLLLISPSHYTLSSAILSLSRLLFPPLLPIIDLTTYSLYRSGLGLHSHHQALAILPVNMHIVHTDLRRCWAEVGYRRTPVLRMDLHGSSLRLNDSYVDDVLSVVCDARSENAYIFICRDTVISLTRLAERLGPVVTEKVRSLQSMVPWTEAPPSRQSSGISDECPAVVDALGRGQSRTPSGGSRQAAPTDLSAAPAEKRLPHARKAGRVVEGKILVRGHGATLACFQGTLGDRSCIRLLVGSYSASFEQLPDGPSAFQV